MKTILRAILAVAVAGSPIFASQDPQTEKEKQKKEELKKQAAQTPAQEPQPEEKPKPKPKPKQEPAPPPQQPKPEEKQQQKEQEKQQKEQAKQSNKQQTTQPNKQTRSAQGGQARGMKIPDPKFRASFGQEHRFRVASSARDDRRFHYGGYWFEVVEVWPAGWSFDDDCYIEEDGDDYYLVDYVHPEVRVLVIVVEG